MNRRVSGKTRIRALFWICCVTFLEPAPAQITFTDVGESTNSVVRVNLHGSGFFDCDGDGWDDIYVVHNSSLGSWRSFPNALLKNLRNNRFEDIAEAAGCQGLWVQSAQGFAAADYNNDGFTDLAIACGNNFDKALLYRNRGDGTFAIADAGLTEGHYTYRGRNVSFIDADNDGRLDLFFLCSARTPDYTPELPACVLYRNNGDGSFARSGAGLDSWLATDGDLYGFAVADVDLDGDQDIFVPRRDTQSLLLINDGSGSFTDRFIAWGLPAPSAGETYYTGAVFLDFDNDGFWDLFVRRAYKPALLFKNTGAGRFVEVGAAAGVNRIVPYVGNSCFGGGLSTGDFDNDGDVDLLVITEWAMELLFFRNNGNGTFTEIAESAGLREDLYDYWSAPVGDYDRDGRLDIYFARSNSSDPRGGGHLYRNTGGGSPANKWIQIRLTGVSSNRSAVGSRLTLVAGGKRQMRQVLGGAGYMTNSYWVHFGLGSASVVDSLIVYWPSGLVQRLTGIPAGYFISVTEGVPTAGYDSVSVEGTVRHSPTGYPINRAALRLTGGMSMTVTTGPDGTYHLYPVLDGTRDLLLTPSKNVAEDVGLNTVTAFDASLTLRHVAGIERLNVDGAAVADADRDGTLNALDAAFIARYAVGRRNDGISSAGGWLFNPAVRSIEAISGSMTGQDFQCRVIGDVSQNWGVPLSPGKTGSQAAVSPSRIEAPSSGGVIEIPLIVEANSGLLAADGWFRLEGSGLTFEGAETTELTEGYQTEWNGPSDGLWKIALYGIRPVNEAGIFLKLRFRTGGNGGTVVWERFAVNEREMCLSETVISGAGIGKPVPSGFGLDWNYPNPFNPATSVCYRLDRPGDAGLIVYDVRGRRVAELARGWREAGEYRADWDGRDDSGREGAAGVYICRLESAGRVQVIKMVKMP
jgi:hypothetical protein